MADFNQTFREIVTSDDKKHVKHDIGKVNGRVDSNSKPKKFINRVLEEGLPSIIRVGLTKIFGSGVGDYLADVVQDGVERSIYGSRKRSSNGYLNYSSSFEPSYWRSYSTVNTSPSTASQNITPQAQHPQSLNFEDITTMRDRPAAADLLMKMNHAIGQYHCVSVGELFDCLGLPQAPYTYEYYGWKMPLGNIIRQNSYGFWLDLPTPVQIP